MAGDFDYPGITDASLKAQFGIETVWYPVVGNHELDFESELDDFQWVLDAYPLPNIVNEGPTGSVGTTYSWDYGNAHFVAINEYYDGTSDVGTDGEVRSVGDVQCDSPCGQRIVLDRNNHETSIL